MKSVCKIEVVIVKVSVFLEDSFHCLYSYIRLDWCSVASPEPYYEIDHVVGSFHVELDLMTRDCLEVFFIPPTTHSLVSQLRDLS